MHPEPLLIMTKRTYPEAVQNCVRNCRRVARTALTIVAIFWIVFGLVTGFQQEGQTGSLFDSWQNILPWLAIVVLWIIAWRFEILGGFLIIAFSIYMASHLGVFEGNSTQGLMIITPLAMTGFMFVFIGFRIYLARRAESGKA